jgi:hypothetical protein
MAQILGCSSKRNVIAAKEQMLFPFWEQACKGFFIYLSLG